MVNHEQAQKSSMRPVTYKTHTHTPPHMNIGYSGFDEKVYRPWAKQFDGDVDRYNMQPSGLSSPSLW